MNNMKISLNAVASILLICLLSFFSYSIFANNSVDIPDLLKQAPMLNPHVLKLGLEAYQHAEKLGMDKRGILTIIDYSKPSSQKRLWVINLNKDSVDYHTYVAHGKGSGNNYARHFSNKFHSDATSLGVYLTGETYSGKHGYSMRLHGLEKGFNNHAFQRAVVMHSAWYVSKSFLKRYGRLGRSWGCPALSQKMAPEVIHEIKGGTILLAYYPNKQWLSHSQFV